MAVCQDSLGTIFLKGKLRVLRIMQSSPLPPVACFEARVWDLEHGGGGGLPRSERADGPGDSAGRCRNVPDLLRSTGLNLFECDETYLAFQSDSPKVTKHRAK